MIEVRGARCHSRKNRLPPFILWSWSFADLFVPENRTDTDTEPEPEPVTEAENRDIRKRDEEEETMTKSRKMKDDVHEDIIQVRNHFDWIRVTSSIMLEFSMMTSEVGHSADIVSLTRFETHVGPLLS